MWISFFMILHTVFLPQNLAIDFNDDTPSSTKSIEEMIYDYEDDKNSMRAISEREDLEMYEDFYDEFDNHLSVDDSMNMIFFGPAASFLRLDAESVLHLLVHTKKQFIPIEKVLLAWDIITDGKTAAYLQGREYLAFGSLLNLVPEEDLYYVNFGIPSVQKYFSKHALKLKDRKYGILAASYKRYFGDAWYTNGSYIDELGYLLCGFPAIDLKMIQPHVFKEVNLDILSKINRCSVEQTQVLYDIATHHKAYGKPYKWSSHEISRLSTLLTCIPEKDISSLQLEAIAAITPDVMKSMHQEKLEYFTKQQIYRMNPKARRIFMLRMQLKSSLSSNQIAQPRNSGYSAKPCVFLLFSNIVLSPYFFIIVKLVEILLPLFSDFRVYFSCH